MAVAMLVSVIYIVYKSIKQSFCYLLFSQGALFCFR